MNDLAAIEWQHKLVIGFDKFMNLPKSNFQNALNLCHVNETMTLLNKILIHYSP